ncbi:MAG: BACON domain-containing protein [Thermoanaerobaculales bacterium]
MRNRIVVAATVAGVLLTVAVQARAGGLRQPVGDKATVVLQGNVHYLGIHKCGVSAFGLEGVEGSSVSSPSFAGLMAQIAQRAGAWQGHANPHLYRLGNAQDNGTGATVPHDVTTGDGGGAASGSTVTIFSDNFEGPFPGAWQVANDPSSANTGWGRVTCKAAGGTGSAWCAAGGGSPQSPCSRYVENMATLMMYGPFSLADAATAKVEFDTWYDTEACCDGLIYGVSFDGTNWYFASPLSGTSGGWVHEVLNATDVTEITIVGAPQVWFAFGFGSDSSANGGGVYIDNVVITKTTGPGPCTYSLSSSSQSVASSGGTGSVGVTVTSGSNCSWTATSNAPSWLHVTSGASGTGNGTVGYSVDANTGSARSGTLTIAGLTFTVNQSPCAGCGGSTVTIFSDNFEGAFPGSWQLYFSTGTESTTVWGKSSYRAAGGSHSAWCAGGGTSPQPAGSTYVPNMEVWLEYGPFDLSDATDAAVDFDLWSYVDAGVGNAYPDRIGLYVSTDDSEFWGPFYPNTGQTWQHETFNFRDVTQIASIGAHQVYIAFIFDSDGATQYEGSYIDNVVITKTTGPGPGPCTYSLSSSSQSVANSGGTGSVGVTVISGSNCTWTATSNAPSWLHVTSGASGTGTGTVGYSVDANGGTTRSGTLTIAGLTFTVNQSQNYLYSYWLPVISHTPGSGSTQWRSDVGALNRSGSTASIELVLFTGSGNTTATQTIPGNGQVVYTDLATSLGMTNGSGALEVLSTQQLWVTSRTYNQQPSGWTYGQGYDGIASSDALDAGSTAWLPQLAQTGVAGQVGTSRVNIGITNTGSGTASVTLTLYDANGTQVWTDTRSYTPGQFYQYQEPYRTGAGRTDIAAGYAKITVISGSGVIAYASDIDNGSGDATTVNVKR